MKYYFILFLLLYFQRVESQPVLISPSDKNHFTNLIRNAKIVALGESVHGSATALKVRLEYIKTAYDSLGIDTVMVEMPYADNRSIENYFKAKSLSFNDSCEVFSFYYMKTYEYFAFVDSLKSYIPEVKIMGIDIQEYKKNIRNLNQITIPFPNTIRKKVFPIIDSLKAECLNKKGAENQRLKNGLSVSAKLMDRLENVLKKEKKLYRVHNLEKEFVLLKRSLSFHSDLSSWPGNYRRSNFIRDSLMFENIKLLTNDFSSRAILLGHNGHIQKSKSIIPLGYLLSNHLKKQYKSIATDFYSGKVYCKGWDGKGHYLPPEVTSLEPNEKGLFKLLNKCSFQNYGLIGNYHPKLLRKKVNLWDIGAVCFERRAGNYRSRLSRDFDDAIFFKHSESFTPLLPMKKY